MKLLTSDVNLRDLFFWYFTVENIIKNPLEKNPLEKCFDPQINPLEKANLLRSEEGLDYKYKWDQLCPQ